MQHLVYVFIFYILLECLFRDDKQHNNCKLMAHSYIIWNIIYDISNCKKKKKKKKIFPIAPAAHRQQMLQQQYIHIVIPWHGNAFRIIGLLSLRWRHNGRDSVSNHQPDCLLNRLFRRRSKKTSKLRVTGLLCGEFTGDRWIPRTNGQ